MDGIWVKKKSCEIPEDPELIPEPISPIQRRNDRNETEATHWLRNDMDEITIPPEVFIRKNRAVPSVRNSVLEEPESLIPFDPTGWERDFSLGSVKATSLFLFFILKFILLFVFFNYS